MNKKLLNRITTITVFTLMIALIAGVIGFGNTDIVDASEFLSSDIVIAHITDVHYFPFEDCNIDDPTSKDTDYYKLTCSDTKLIREAGTIFNATILNIITQKPDYLIVSGDLTSNGELLAHYDVANGLRYLQNEIRKTNENFQVFVIPGNHDIYNPTAARFDADGNIYTGDDNFTDAETFAQIYAGLGYPNISEYSNQDELKNTFTSKNNTFGFTSQYIVSDNAENIDYLYYYDEIGFPVKDYDKAVNCLSYIAIVNDIDYVFNCMDSTERNANDSTFGFKQITGGRVSADVLNWYKENTINEKNNNFTIVGTVHHNIAPHYSMEENITKDFTLYNWEDSATFMADELGIRYVFTGHMHATDRTQFTTYRGNTITDFETGSIVSYKAPTRYATISRTIYDEKLYEDVTTKVIPVENLKNVQSFLIDIPKSFENEPDFFYFSHITDLTNHIEKEIYNIMLEKFVNGFINEDLYSKLYDMVADIIPPSISFGKLNLDLPYSAVMKVVVLLLDDIFYGLNYQIGEVKYNSLIDMAHALIKKEVANDEDLLQNSNGEKGLLNIVVYTDNEKIYTLEDIVVKIYVGHLTGNEAEDYNALDKATKELLDQLITTDIDNNIVKKIVDTALKPLLLDDGALLPSLINHKFDLTKLYFDESITDPAEIAVRFTQEEQEDFLGIIGAVSVLIDGIYDDYICLNEATQSLFVLDLLGSLGLDLNGMNIIDWAKDFIDKYMTESFFTGIGGIIREIALSWATDDTPDGEISYFENDELKEVIIFVDNGFDMGITVGDKKIGTAYDGKPYYTKATYDDGRLPSHATATFGDDPATSVNLQFYTHYTVNGQVKYREVGDTDWHIIDASTIREPFAYPLFDIGYFATYTDVLIDKKGTKKYTLGNRDEAPVSVKFTNIHSITLTGLKANTKYEYVLIGTYDIGNSEEKIYETAIKSFKTALPIGSDEEFSILAMTDVQAMIQKNYEDALKSFKAITQPYDFIINCGDVVDSGKNIKQWGYSQNILSSIWGNTLTVVTAGNHEDSDYALSSYYNFGNVPAQDTESGVYYSFNYGNVHFVMLNTNDSDSKGLGEAQLNWLKNDLQSAKENSNIKWTIVGMHKGLYSSGSHSFDTEVVAMRGQLSSIFYDYDVDLVLQGHDHVYNTTGFLDRLGNTVNVRQDNSVVQKPQGIMYITLGTMGNKYYEYRENELVTPKNNNDMTYSGQLTMPTYTIISVKNDQLIITNNMIGNPGFSASVTIDKGAEITVGTKVELDYIKLAGINVTNGSKVLTNFDTTINYLTIARKDYGSNVKVTVNNETVQELTHKALKSGENNITIELMPENNNEENALELTFSVYKMNELIINGQQYKLGTKLNLTNGITELDIKYNVKKNDTFEIVNNNLVSGDNQVLLRVTTEGGNIYEQAIDVIVASEATQPKSSLIWILSSIGGLAIIIGIVVAIIVLNKRKNATA